MDDRDAACSSCGSPNTEGGYNFAAAWTAWGGELANGGGGYPPIYRTGEPAANLEDAVGDILGYCPIILCDVANGGRFVAKCSGGDCDFWLAAELACVKGCGDALKGALKFSDEALFGARAARLGIETVDDVPSGWRDQDRFYEALAEANARYPHLASENQAHHVIPKALNSDEYTGPTVSVPWSYHVLITNETEALRKAAGGGKSFSDEQMRTILDQVYAKYPLPEN